MKLGAGYVRGQPISRIYNKGNLIFDGGNVPFTPLSVPVRRWYEPSNPSTFTQSSGSVDQLNDLSVNVGHVSNVGSLRPTVQSGFIRFTTSQYLFNAMPCLGQNNKSCVYAVIQGAPQNNGAILGEGSTVNSSNLRYMTNSGTSSKFTPLYINSDASDQIFGGETGTDIADGTKKIIRIHHDLLTFQSFGNGTVGAIPRAHNIVGNYAPNRFAIAGVLGNSFGSGGAYDLYELIITDDDTYGLEFEGYLAHKYGLTADLPASHPYKTNPPMGVPNYAPPVVTAPITAALVGDSITAWNSYADQTVRVYQSSTGWFTSYELLSKNRINFPVVNNLGIAGAQTPAILTSMVANLGSKTFDTCFIKAGTNDISNNRPAGDIALHLLRMINHVVYTLGKKVVITPIEPRSGISPTQLSRIANVNAWVVGQQASMQGRVMAFDTVSALDDGSGAPIANSTYDGLHLAPYGGRIEGQQLANALLPYYGEGTYNFGAGNLLSNGLMTGSAGTTGSEVTGNVATGFTAYGSGGTGGRTASKDTDDTQLLRMAVTGGTNADYLRLEQAISSGFIVGDTVYAQVLVEFTGVPQNIYGNSLELILGGSSLPSLQRVVGNAEYTNAYMVPEQYGSPRSLLLIQTPDLPLTAGTGLSLTARYRMFGNSATTPSDGQVKIRGMGVFKR